MTPEQVRELREVMRQTPYSAPSRAADCVALCDSWLLQQKVVDAARQYVGNLDSDGMADDDALVTALAALSAAASPGRRRDDVELSPKQLAVLRAFAKLDPNAEWEHSAWSPALEAAVKTETSEAGIGCAWWERELQPLTHKKLLVASDRGSWRQWGITQAGLDAVIASPVAAPSERP